jgi:hypothetical protein
MTQIGEPHLAEIGIRLMDDAYIAWLAAETQASEALSAWFDAGPRHEHAYHAYLAALDREQAAALDLERLWAVAEPCRAAMTPAEQSVTPHPTAP